MANDNQTPGSTLQDLASATYNLVRHPIAGSALPPTPAAPAPPKGTIPAITQDAVKEKYKLPANADLTKPYLDPVNKDVQDAVAFSQAYQEFNPPAPKKSILQRMNPLTDTAGVEVGQAPQTLRDVAAPLEWEAGGLALEAAAPYVKKLVGPVVSDLAERAYNWRVARDAAKAAESDSHTITLSPSEYNFDDLGGTERMPSEVSPVMAKTATPETAGAGTQPNADVAESANRYNRARGGPEINHAPATLAAPEARAALADKYEALEHKPADAAVKKAYSAFKTETLDQFNHAKNGLGIKFEFTPENPYETAEQMTQDVRDNKHLAVYTGGNDFPEGHPTTKIEPTTGQSYNNLFRATHDIYGHAAGGHEFTEPGEEAAYQAHVQMYSPEARPAVQNETQGQSNWYFNNKAVREGGPLGAFAQQKAAVLPETKAEVLVGPNGSSSNDLDLTANPDSVQKTGGGGFSGALREGSKAANVPEWVAGEFSHEIDRLQTIVRNPDSTQEEKDIAGHMLQHTREMSANRDIGARLDGIARQAGLEYKGSLPGKGGDVYHTFDDPARPGDQINVKQSDIPAAGAPQFLQNRMATKRAQPMGGGESLEQMRQRILSEASKPAEDISVVQKSAPATQPLQPRSKEMQNVAGTVRDDIHHEMGHILVGRHFGVGNTDGIWTEYHPDNHGGLAAVQYDFSSWGVGSGEIVSNDTVKNHLDELLTMFMGGGAGDETTGGRPMDQNPSMHGDLSVMRRVLRGIGYSEEEIVKKIAKAQDRARQILTDSGAPDIMKKYSAAREEGLAKTHHTSQERVDEMAQEVANVKQQKAGKAGNDVKPTGGGAIENRQPNVPAGESAGAQKPGQKTPQLGLFDDLGGQQIGPLAKSGPDELQNAPESKPFSGIHYSNTPAENGELSGERRGTGKTGAEKTRIQHENVVPGVNVYREGVPPESQFAGAKFQHTIQGNKAIADITGKDHDLFVNAVNDAQKKYVSAGDPAGVAHQKALNDGERALRDAGFDGYELGDNPRNGVFLFGDQKVEPIIKKADMELPADNTAGIRQVMAAYRRLGMTEDQIWRSIRHHEAGHAWVQAKRGFFPEEMESHLGSSNLGGAQVTDYSKGTNPMKTATPIRGERGSFSFAESELRERYKDIIAGFLGGGAAQEALDSLPMDENPGMSSDWRQIGVILNGLEFSPEEKKAIITAIKDEVRKEFTSEAVKAKIREHTETRQETDPSLQMSAERVGNMIREAQEAEHGEKNRSEEDNTTEHDGGASEGGGAIEPRGESKDAGANQTGLSFEKTKIAVPKNWSDVAAKRAAKQSAGGIDPATGKSDEKGIGAEFMPEARQPLDHKPTVADFQQFYEKNKDILDSDPSLRVGWDNNSKVAGGHEINIGAVGAGAVKMARKLDQRAAWDIGKGAEVSTGGEGLQTSFPNYPVKERTNDLHDRPQSNIPGFENVPARVFHLMNNDLKTYLSDKPDLQKRVVAELHKNPVLVQEGVDSAQAGADLNGWWRRYIDLFNRIGDAGATKTDANGVPYSEILKQWHAGVSGNKKVEDANNLAFHSFIDWLDAGQPTDRASLDSIIRQNGAQPEGSPKRGNAAMSDTHRKGKVVTEGIDTSKLFSLVNSPEMRGEKSFSGNIYSEEHPLRGKRANYRKIPSMGATVAGTGDLSNAVLDTHIFDFLGMNLGTEARYIANSLYLTDVAQQLGLPAGEAQEQIWGTTLKFKGLLKEGLTPEEAADKIIQEGVYEEGKDYSDIILNDPEISGKGGVLDRLQNKYGIGPGSQGIRQIHQATRAAEPARATTTTAGQESINPTNLASAGARIKGTITESKIKKPTTQKRLNFADFISALRQSGTKVMK